MNYELNNTARTVRPLPQGRIIDDCRHDLDMGAVLGALIGDAAGATLEFLGRQPTAVEVEQALGMCGGGIWNTAPGQVTDDGELTLALLQALAGQPRYDVNRAARAYRRWYLSAPFDIGNATGNALEDGDPDSPGLAELIARRASMFNSESKANGSLIERDGVVVGSALLGLKVGDSIAWPGPAGRTIQVEILEVVYQPERAGELHR